MRGVVPPPQDARTFLPAQNVQAADRTIGMRSRRLQQANEPPRNRLHGVPLEQVGGVFDHPRYPRRGAVRAALFAHAHREVELGRGARHRLKPRRKPRHIKARRRIVLERQHHLEQRMVRQRSCRVEHLNQPLKRQLRMAVGQKIAGANPPNQRAQARIPRGVRAQHQRVHKEAHEIVERAVAAPRNRAADHNVAARSKPREQRRQASLQHHEQARSPRARKPCKRNVQLSRHPQSHHLPAVARNRRPPTVARQIDRIGKPGKLPAPEPQLARYRALAIALLSQHFMLPQRVVGILHRQRRQSGRLPAPARRIAMRKIPQQRRQRPAVPGNVVQKQKQYVRALRELKQMRPQRRLRAQIKALTRRTPQRPRKRRLAHRRDHKPRPHRARRKDLLMRNTLALREDRAQALVALHHIPQPSLQRRHIQRSFQPHRHRDRVGRALVTFTLAFQPMQKPQPPLRIRQRDLARPRNRTKRRTRCRRLAQPGRQSLHRGRLEQAADRYLRIQARPDAADQPRRQQRMTPELKEIVRNPNPENPQHFPKQRAQDLLLRRARPPPQRKPSHLRRRQRAPVELAIGRERKPLQYDIGRWHHVVRNAPRNVRPQRSRFRRSSPGRHHIAHQPLVPSRVLTRNHRSLGHPRMAQQHRLDLARLNAKAAQLHLRIRAPEKVQHPVRTPARNIPAAVHPASRSTKPVRNKPLRRQPRTIQIAPRKPRPRYVQLPRYPRRYRLQTAVQHVHPRVPDRPANGNRRSNRHPLSAAIDGRPNTTFSWTIFVCEQNGGKELVMFDYQFRRARLARQNYRL